MTFSASRLASAAGAVALIVATFLPWVDFLEADNAWSAYPGLAAALVVSAGLALVPRAGAASTVVALATLVAVVVALRGDILAAATGPAVAFVGLTLIAAGSVGLRARRLIAVGAFALLISTFAPWTRGAIEGAYFNRSVGAPAYAFVGDVGDLWSGPGSASGPGPWLAAAALCALAAGVVTLARSR